MLLSTPLYEWYVGCCWCHVWYQRILLTLRLSDPDLIHLQWKPQEQGMLHISIINSLTHICISKLTIVGYISGPLGTNFNEILIKIRKFSFMTIHFKMSRKWQPFCLGCNVSKGVYEKSYIFHDSVSYGQIDLEYVMLECSCFTWQHHNIEMLSTSLTFVGNLPVTSGFFSQRGNDNELSWFLCC